MADSSNNPVSLFQSVVSPKSGFSEAWESKGQFRAHWKPVIDFLDRTRPRVIKQRHDRVKRMRHEDGATFNPFEESSERLTPWNLDIIPMPVTAREWKILETGLIQRATLLEKILADIYGPQSLIHEGRIPAEMIFANPHFLRACNGIQPAGGRFLTFYAVDVYRDENGGFRVLRDWGGAPQGLGYALENRIVMSRVFSDFYHDMPICRLAPFFKTFHNALVQRAILREEDPKIVLLSPGPDSPIYFEHALLSRYLNYTLVEGQDLTVRNGEVFLKKLNGLEPVEAIFRYINDESSDPFALRRGTATGVAGLIQVAREGNIEIINPIGSSFIETPALSVLLPDLCRSILGNELSLGQHPAWWCRDEDSRNHVLAQLDSLVIRHALKRSTSRPAKNGLKQAIKDKPYGFMAREPVRPSTVPVWDQNRIQPYFALMRLFVCATENGFSVLPGGLCTTAPDVKTLLSNDPQKQQSKDIWVASDQPVEPFSLISGLQTAAEFNRSSDIPSRVADHLLWLGRYMERAEGRVRLLRSVFRRISSESRMTDIDELPFLLTLLREQDNLPPLSDKGSAILKYRQLLAYMNSTLYEKGRPESVVTILHQVQQAARHVRDWFSVDSWRVINRLKDMAGTPTDDPIELLDDILYALNAFSGLAMESMTRGLGWRFMDMGRRIERGINTTALIRTGLSELYGQSPSILEALLEVSASIMTYRSRYRTTFQLAPVLDLLLIDESNPKSLAFQCSQLAAHVEHLPRQNERRFSNPEERLVLSLLTSVRLFDLAGLDVRKNDADESPLPGFLESMEEQLMDFAQVVTAHYLSRVPAIPHYSVIEGDSEP